MNLRVHSILRESYANGPGPRAVLWVQGCALECPGCFNPSTHASTAGEVLSVQDTFERLVDSPRIEGVTISGGEPLEQAEPLLNLLRLVKERTALGIVLFTGYRRVEIARSALLAETAAAADVVIAGRYVQSQRLARSLTGSKNKEFIFNTARYSPADFSDTPEAEIVISGDGTLSFSGIDPLKAFA